MSKSNPEQNLKASLKRGVSLSKLKRSTYAGLDNFFRNMLNSAIDSVAEDCVDWAEDTYYDLVANTPHDTGNLRNSIDVPVYTDGIGVGVNERKLLWGTPREMPSQKHPGIMRTIPDYNYVYMAEAFTKEVGASGKNLHNFTTTVWVELARRNARQIFGSSYRRRMK